MKKAGWSALEEHVPELRGRRGFTSVALGFIAVLSVTTLFFILVDRGFPAWMPDGEIVVLALGFLIVSRSFTQKARYQREFGIRAYATAFVRFVIPGLGIIAASIGHLAYMAGPEIPDLWWTPILRVAGWILVFLGAALWLRAVSRLGLDSLVMLYVYLPAEGRLAESGIYTVIRHPVYAAALNIGAGLAMIHANWYALLVVPVLSLFFFGWIRLVEEPELIRRFPGYMEYRRRIPAFWPWPRELPSFFRLIVLGH